MRDQEKGNIKQGRKVRFANEELLRNKGVCNCSCESLGFSGGPGNSSFKKFSHNKSFERIKRKFDKSLKNRQSTRESRD